MTFEALSIEWVRNMARVHGYDEVQDNRASSVLGFVRESAGARTRIQVWYTTGTVGTYLEHPRQGKTQLFRRRVDMCALAQIFDNPRTHTGKGYHTTQRAVPADEEAAVAEALAALDDQLADIRRQQSDLAIQLQEIQRDKRQKAALAAELERRRIEAQRHERERLAREAAAREEAARKERERLAKEAEARADAARKAARARQLLEEEAAREQQLREEEEARAGRYCDWALHYSEHIPSDMADVRCVAVGGGGYVAVDKNGSCGWHGIPHNVVKALNRQHRKCIAYVAIGYESSYGDEYPYFIRKTNGKFLSEGLPEPLLDAIHDKSRSCSVRFMALGVDAMYFVKFEDGSSQWSSRLDPKLQSILREYEVVTVWLGDEDSYFVSYEANGRTHRSYKNLPRVLQHQASKGHRDIRLLVCDEDGNFFVRYS